MRMIHGATFRIDHAYGMDETPVETAWMRIGIGMLRGRELGESVERVKKRGSVYVC
jgi:hypothetical protein